MMASVCTGAILLAQAGVLEGRTATTHRGNLDQLAAMGDIDVDREARVVDTGDVLTCGGVTSGLDLAFHIVEREWGAGLANRIAELMEHERRGRCGDPVRPGVGFARPGAPGGVGLASSGMKILYWAEAVSEGGRIGRAYTTDGALEVPIVIPADLGGPEGEPGTNPEQLFACGYAACFHSSMKTIAGMKKIDLSESKVTARVGLGPTGTGGFGLETELHVEIPGLEREVAHSLIRKSHRRCPYSNATRGNMAVAITVNGEPLEQPVSEPSAA